LPWKITSERSSKGPFQRERGLASHWRKTCSTCVASQTPATSTRSSSTTSASVPRIGPAVSSGVAMRTRRRAAPIRLAIRCESSGPRPGQNQGRMPSTGAVSKSPESPIRLLSQICSKLCVNAAATARESSVAITFSWRVNESSVQFIEPVQTASPSRTTYLWCIRSRQPGIGFTGTPSVSSTSGSVYGGAGKNGRSSASGGRSSWLNAIRTVTPRAAASLIAPATRSPTSSGRRTS
jgi:hypothetical protein